MLQNKEWQACTTMANYWKAQKPVCFIRNCLLRSSISIEQYKKHLCNLSCHYRKYGRFTRVARAPYTSMRENHNASILAISNSFHNIIAERSVSAIMMSCTEAITH